MMGDSGLGAAMALSSAREHGPRAVVSAARATAKAIRAGAEGMTDLDARTSMLNGAEAWDYFAKALERLI